jgi:L-malate glycosyltransferase
MGKYVIELLTNERKYNIFSKKSRERAVINFDVSKVVPLYEEHYRRILNDE